MTYRWKDLFPCVRCVLWLRKTGYVSRSKTEPGTPMYPGRRFALPWAISFCPFGAGTPQPYRVGTVPGFLRPVSCQWFLANGYSRTGSAPDERVLKKLQQAMVGGLMVQSDQLASDAKRVAMPRKPNRLGKINQRTIQDRLLDPLQKIRVVDVSNPTLGIFEARTRSASPRGSQQAIGKGRPLIDTHATVPQRAECLRDDPSFLHKK